MNTRTEIRAGADKIRRLSLTTRCLWRFLKRAVAGSIVAVIGAGGCHLSDRTWPRLWKRFDQGQSKIRTALPGRCPPPELPALLEAINAAKPRFHGKRTNKRAPI